MTETDFGFECICGLKKDRMGNDISDDLALEAGVLGTSCYIRIHLR